MSRMIRDWALALGVGFLVFWLADVLSHQGGSSARGGPAPAFTLEKIDGGAIALDDVRGGVAVLNFFATWCGPCKAEMPEFSAYALAHPEVKVIGLVVPSNEGARLPEIIHRFRLTYPVVVVDSLTERAYAIHVFPTTVVVKADGSISDRIEGAIDGKTLAKAVARAGS